MQKFLAVALLTCGLAMKASAQEPNNEISGTIGRSIIGDQTVPNAGIVYHRVYFGHGTSFDINFAHRVRRYSWAELSLEVPVIFNPDEDLSYGANVIPQQYSSYFITPAARVNFVPDLAISPWLSFGGGFGIFHASSNLVYSGPNPGDRTKTTGVLQGGVGLDVPLPRVSQLKFRFEARDDWSGVAPLNVNTGRSRQHNYYVAAGAVYRF